MSATDEAHARVKDALDNARNAAQELYGALSDVVATHSGAIRTDLEALPLKAKAIAASLGHSLDAQNVETRRTLDEAVSFLESTATHAAEAIKSTGAAAETSIRQAVADASASVQKIDEAAAAKRAAEAKPGAAT